MKTNPSSSDPLDGSENTSLSSSSSPPLPLVSVKWKSRSDGRLPSADGGDMNTSTTLSGLSGVRAAAVPAAEAKPRPDPMSEKGEFERCEDLSERTCGGDRARDWESECSGERKRGGDATCGGGILRPGEAAATGEVIKGDAKVEGVLKLEGAGEMVAA